MFGKRYLCLNCYTEGRARSKPKIGIGWELVILLIFGSLGLFLFWPLLIVPLIMVFVAPMTRRKVCKKCGSGDLISSNSPRARKILSNQI